jgi:hypothetical protein
VQPDVLSQQLLERGQVAVGGRGEEALCQLLALLPRCVVARSAGIGYLLH